MTFLARWYLRLRTYLRTPTPKLRASVRKSLRIPVKPQRPSQFLDSTKRNSTRCVP